jgi:hypothetical protein
MAQAHDRGDDLIKPGAIVGRDNTAVDKLADGNSDSLVHKNFRANQQRQSQQETDMYLQVDQERHLEAAERGA